MHPRLLSLRQRRPRLFAAQSLALFLALGAGPPAFAGPVVPSEAVHAGGQAPLELVESWPEETTLDHADLRDAKEVWPELFAAARRRVDLAEFYLDSAPGSALERSVLALEAAAGRGVQVRLLCDEKFYKNYPATADRLGKAGVDVRRLDYKKVAGGVLHAKYFLVDGEQVYLGSQNFDWRSLQHIQELGLRIRVPEVVRALQATFDQDWAIAGGAAKEKRASVSQAPTGFPVAVGDAWVTAAISPQGALPDERLWDLPMLVSLIDHAQSTVRVQLLTYKAKGRDGEPFPDLEEALQRAAARGVRVELLLSHWSLRKGTVEGLQRLERAGAGTAGKGSLHVRIMKIPEAKAGYLPYARVVHAKYLVVDGARAWVGTSNWERDYFTASRNVGLVIEGGALPKRLDRFFLDGWDGAYAKPLDPEASYPAPRTGP
jgi:phosphatidylserine/phosphatidylglycerophosphate/cardiolipin synthase-like enzyme